VSGLKSTVRQLHNKQTTHIMEHLFAALYANHAQIAPGEQELLIALGQYTFLLGVKANTNNLHDGHCLVDFDWLSPERVVNCSHTGLNKNGKLMGKWENRLKSHLFPSHFPSPDTNSCFLFFPLFPAISRQKSRCKTCSISSHHKNLI
jgi:hypothetical protein